MLSKIALRIAQFEFKLANDSIDIKDANVIKQSLKNIKKLMLLYNKKSHEKPTEHTSSKYSGFNKSDNTFYEMLLDKENLTEDDLINHSNYKIIESVNKEKTKRDSFVCTTKDVDREMSKVEKKYKSIFKELSSKYGNSHSSIHNFYYITKEDSTGSFAFKNRSKLPKSIIDEMYIVAYNFFYCLYLERSQ